MGLPYPVKSAAFDLLDRVLPSLHHTRSGAISLACLFIAANRDGGNAGRHIPLRDFCRRLDLDKYAIAKAKRWILTNKFEEPDDPERLAEAQIVSRLRERDIPISYERKVTRLMSLIRKAWVSAGKVEELFIWPCVFVLSDNEVEGCWQPVPTSFAQQDDASRKKTTTFKKMTPSKFYAHYRLKDVLSKAMFTMRLHDVKEFLLSLTRSVPWLPASQRGTKAGLMKSLEWLLEHDEWCREMIERRNDKKTDGDDVSDKFLPSSLKKSLAAGEKSIPEEVPETISVPSGEELGDEDIKDEDMHLFIRSKEEVDNISKFCESQNGADSDEPPLAIGT